MLVSLKFEIFGVNIKSSNLKFKIDKTNIRTNNFKNWNFHNQK